VGHCYDVGTFNELIVEAERAIRARIDSEADELTGYFVAQGAVLLACLRYWAQIEGRTDAEVQAATETADKGTLEKAVRNLAESDDPDALMASRLLQVIAGRPQPHLFETSHCIQGVPVSSVPSCPWSQHRGPAPAPSARQPTSRHEMWTSLAT
jgi:hypothetical protein